MDKLVIKGGNTLHGKVDINGAKNAAVAIIPSAIMASEGICTIDNISDIEDVNCLERIIKSLGCDVSCSSDAIIIDSTKLNSYNANTEDVRKMRASYYLIGALLGRFKKARVELPGGCPIGARPMINT